MSKSRRTFLKTAAGIAAGTVWSRPSVWAQGHRAALNPGLMITPDQAWDWHVFKSQCGPTYAGSAGWKRFTEFLLSKITEYGGIDLDFVDIPYDHYVVDDWPDRRTHVHDSGIACEKLVTATAAPCRSWRHTA